MIDGVIVTPLKQIPTDNGAVFHGLKKSEASFHGFAEAYFSWIHANHIKGWKKHTQMILNIIVPIGKIQFALFDDRENSPSKGQTFKIEIGEKNYQRLTVPAGIWVAFKGLDEKNMLMNLANLEHNPNEAVEKKLSEIDFPW